MTDKQTHRRIDVDQFEPFPEAPVLQLPVLDWVEISSLVFDETYQRSIEKSGRANIGAIARDFDWRRFTPLLVAPIGDGSGDLAVIDGQHRSHAAALVGFTRVPAMIVDADQAEQARAFSWVNGNTTAVSGFHIFKAALASGENRAVESRKAVEDGGCKLMTSNISASNKKPGEVFCISAIRKFVEDGHADLVTKALTALVASQQGRDVHMYSAEVLKPWINCVCQFDTITVGRLGLFLDTHSFADVLGGVARMRETPDYFRSSTRALFEQTLVALFRKWKKEADAA